jgi:pyridoxamine 5'-phosphate oxidase
MSMADLRREYNHGTLSRSELQADPLVQFQAWFDQAGGTRSGSRWRGIGIALYKLWNALLGTPPVDVNAMVLATADKAGTPSARTVLLKGVDARGFIFFTNYDSRKGQELAENPRAALVFYWADHGKQVCVSGTVSKLPREESEAYHRSRPRGSRIAAWASNQSQVIPDRETLEQKWKDIGARFPTDDVPLPPNWGGYVLSPATIEFWQGRLSRMHDRLRCTRQPDNTWKVDRLSP